MPIVPALSRSSARWSRSTASTISTASSLSRQSRSPTRGRARCTTWELQNRSVCHIYVVRTPDCRVAGFCAFWLVVDEIHINNVAVLPAYRARARHAR